MAVHKLTAKGLLSLAVLGLCLLIIDRVIFAFHLTDKRFAYDRQLGYVNRSHMELVFQDDLIKTGAKGTILLPGQSLGPSCDLLVVGDSYAAGQSATYPGGSVELAAEILAHKHPQLVVVNGAVSGYGTDQCLLRFRQLRHLTPTLVIYYMFENDLWDNFDHYHYGLYKPGFSLVDGELVQSHHPSVWNWFVLHTGWGEMMGKASLMRRKGRHKIEYKSYSPQERRDLALALIRQLRREAREIGADLGVIGHYQASRRQAPEELQLLIDSLRQDRIPLLLLNEHIDLEPYYVVWTSHWNDEGHRLVAPWVADFIQRNFGSRLSAAQR